MLDDTGGYHEACVFIEPMNDCFMGVIPLQTNLWQKEICAKNDGNKSGTSREIQHMPEVSKDCSSDPTFHDNYGG